MARDKIPQLYPYSSPLTVGLWESCGLFVVVTEVDVKLNEVGPQIPVPVVLLLVLLRLLFLAAAVVELFTAGARCVSIPVFEFSPVALDQMEPQHQRTEATYLSPVPGQLYTAAFKNIWYFSLRYSLEAREARYLSPPWKNHPPGKTTAVLQVLKGKVSTAFRFDIL